MFPTLALSLLETCDISKEHVLLCAMSQQCWVCISPLRFLSGAVSYVVHAAARHIVITKGNTHSLLQPSR
jgi:hypothetical protein